MGKIIEGHTFDEYQDKYGKKFDNGKLQFVKLEDNNKLDSKKTYWLIKDKNPGYYQVSNLNFIIPIVIFGVAAVATAIAVPCALLLNKRAIEYGVSCDVAGVTISNLTAKEGEDYSTKITYEPTISSVTLPRLLDKVTINEKELELSKYTYTLNHGSLTADFFVPSEYVTGNIKITFTPSKIEKWYLHSDWYNYCSSGVVGEEADGEDIGKNVQLKVNNQNHKIRLIGLDHDDEVDSEGKIIGKAHTTFQFANLLCDENGYSLGAIEDFEHNEGCMSRNYDYLNSGLRKNLTGRGDSEIIWFQKGEVNRSQEYGSVTVMDMLPQELKSVLKEVKKEIYTDADHQWDYQPTYYDDKLFVPTYREMFKEGSDWDSSFYEEGTTYNYYLEDDPSRIFNQISNDSYTETPSIEDVFKGVVSPQNYAGYCSGDSSADTNVIFASPAADSDDSILGIESAYEMPKATNGQAFGITPCFCI